MATIRTDKIRSKQPQAIINSLDTRVIWLQRSPNRHSTLVVCLGPVHAGSRNGHLNSPRGMVMLRFTQMQVLTRSRISLMAFIVLQVLTKQKLLILHTRDGGGTIRWRHRGLARPTNNKLGYPTTQLKTAEKYCTDKYTALYRVSQPSRRQLRSVQQSNQYRTKCQLKTSSAGTPLPA